MTLLEYFSLSDKERESVTSDDIDIKSLADGMLMINQNMIAITQTISGFNSRIASSEGVAKEARESYKRMKSLVEGKNEQYDKARAQAVTAMKRLVNG